MKPNKQLADVFQEKPLTAAEEHYILIIDLLELKQTERISPEEEIEVRGWIKELWEQMSLEERAIELTKADHLSKKYGDIL